MKISRHLITVMCWLIRRRGLAPYVSASISARTSSGSRPYLEMTSRRDLKPACTASTSACVSASGSICAHAGHSKFGSASESRVDVEPSRGDFERDEATEYRTEKLPLDQFLQRAARRRQAKSPCRRYEKFTSAQIGADFPCRQPEAGGHDRSMCLVKSIPSRVCGGLITVATVSGGTRRTAAGDNSTLSPLTISPSDTMPDGSVRKTHSKRRDFLLRQLGVDHGVGFYRCASRSPTRMKCRAPRREISDRCTWHMSTASIHIASAACAANGRSGARQQTR